MKKIIVILLLVQHSIFASGQTSIDTLINDFFKTYQIDRVKAIDDLYKTNPWSTKITDGILSLKKEVMSYDNDYMGKYYGHELLIFKKVADTYALVSHVVKYDRQPMRFTFQFYKPSDKWRLYSFNIDSNLDDEVEESSKLQYNIKPGNYY